MHNSYRAILLLTGKTWNEKKTCDWVSWWRICGKNQHVSHVYHINMIPLWKLIVSIHVCPSTQHVARLNALQQWFCQSSAVWWLKRGRDESHRHTVSVNYWLDGVITSRPHTPPTISFCSWISGCHIQWAPYRFPKENIPAFTPISLSFSASGAENCDL